MVASHRSKQTTQKKESVYGARSCAVCWLTDDGVNRHGMSVTHPSWSLSFTKYDKSVECDTE